MLKAELRKLFLQKRKKLTEIQFQTLSKDLCIQVLKHINSLPPNQKIASFLPIAAKHEIETPQIHQQIQQLNQGHKLCFPRVVNENMMQFYCMQSENDLEISKWGIPEPLEQVSNLINPEEIQIMFIPLLAFDVKGHRVGYGKGFYDQYLAKYSSKIIKIGLSLFDEPSIIDEVESTDIPLDIIITPTRFIQAENY